MKITRIRIYHPKRINRTFNQSNMVVTVETDAGLMGIGEGGTRDTLEQCADMLIGEDPGRIQHLWQMMYRGWFYPAGREKLHALGALDLALWDLKGKALGVPVYDLLGGLTRDYVECYSTGYPRQGSLAETAQACIEAGFRAFRTSVGDSPDGVFDARRQVDLAVEKCRVIRDAIGDRGEWSIDFHTRLDLADAVRLCGLLEPLNPLFVEDPLRSENPGALAALRSQVKAPIAVGEQFGDRWDINELIENHLIDYTRVTLPNVGGITEMVKIAALCETHYVGMIPHFTGPISVAALVHLLGSQPVPALMEIGGAAPKLPPHLKQASTFRDGKLWPLDQPGLGVEFSPSGADLVSEITERSAPIPMYRRPDGSITNW
ncbi:MAG: mandelate racemase/muconate lactonizing enzyme family protein [Anaerolineae bacterium]|nr:mandelate racemase/muconate lactonizing enzyme family protein [Anaerolineae bacterium]